MIIAAFLVLIDQVLKVWASASKINITIIPKILDFVYVENRGMVFGIAQGSSYIMGIVSLVICIAIMAYIFSEKRKGNKIYFPWYMVLAGGFGNMLDRLIRGYVVDFIDTPWIATFNLADTFIVVGVILLVLNQIIKDRKIM